MGVRNWTASGNYKEILLITVAASAIVRANKTVNFLIYLDVLQSIGNRKLTGFRENTGRIVKFFYNYIYCDVPPESRNIGARIYDRFLDNGLAKRLHNRIAPVSIQRKHLYNNRGMLLRYNALVGSVSVTTELLYNVFQIQERRHLVQKWVLR
jgi:hypothetical protein